MQKFECQKGVTLIELVIVLSIIGVLVAGSLSIVKPYIHSARITATEDKMEIIADAISTYVHTNHKMPCPAIPDTTPDSGKPPFGFQNNSGTTGQDTDITCVGADVEGIVPFRTLNLNEETVRDSWGNYMTYRISPAFTLSTTDYPENILELHGRCRYLGWMLHDYDGESMMYYNKNPVKARFCCPPVEAGVSEPTTDVVVQDEDGNSLWSSSRTSASAYYAIADSLATINVMDTPEAKQVESIAFVLVSHGANASGAYTGTAAADKTTAIIVEGTSETENNDGDTVFVSRPYNTVVGNDYYDDIILWRTQYQVYSEIGGESCLIP